MRHAPLPKSFSKLVSDALRANKNLLFGYLEGLFTSQNPLPGWKIFFSARRRVARRNFFEKFCYGQIKPRNGDSFSFRKSSFDLVRGLIGWTRRKARQALAFSQKQHFLRMAVSLTNEKFQNARTKCSLNRVENALDQSDCDLQTRIPGPKH